MNFQKLDNPIANIFLAKKNSEGAIRGQQNQKTYSSDKAKKSKTTKIFKIGPGPIWTHMGPNGPKNGPKWAQMGLFALGFAPYLFACTVLQASSSLALSQPAHDVRKLSAVQHPWQQVQHAAWRPDARRRKPFKNNEVFRIFLSSFLIFFRIFRSQNGPKWAHIGQGPYWPIWAIHYGPGPIRAHVG